MHSLQNSFTKGFFPDGWKQVTHRAKCYFELGGLDVQKSQTELDEIAFIDEINLYCQIN